MITILLSTYNGEKYLSEQLDSILKQSFTDFSVLIRDDCSNDGTLNLLYNYKTKYPDKIDIVDNKNINLQSTNSFFELLKKANSELYCFCDQDDFWENDKLQILFDFYKKNCDDDKPVLIHTYADVVDADLKLLEKPSVLFNNNKHGMEKDFIWQIFQNDVTGCTMMINNTMKQMVCNLNFQDERIIQHDWFFAQVSYLYSSKFLIPRSTIKYRQHENNVIGYNQNKFLKKIKLKLKKHPIYPYYDQISAILKICNIKDTELEKELKSFSLLKNQSKYKRIVWHLTHDFFREGNFLYKIYQLIIC